VTDFLATIARERRERVLRDERRISLAELRDQAEMRLADVRPFAEALRRGTGGSLRAIAEVKRSSPSAGVLREVYDPAAIAATYEKAGASAISVLTEPSRFGGAIEHLIRVRSRTRVPVLLKDFVVHERQLYEGRAAGADAALLIVALLSPVQLRDYAALAREISLEPFIEVHEERELEVALSIEGAAIGVNNRDLRTLEMRSGWAERILPKIPADRVRVAESGYRARAEIEALERVGADAVLVGEALLRAQKPADALRELLGAAAPSGGQQER
jgi:indole-3-glycerol phosphate synthase